MARAKETAEIIHEEFNTVTLVSGHDLNEGNPDHPHTMDRLDRVFEAYFDFVPKRGAEETTLLIFLSSVARYLICR